MSDLIDIWTDRRVKIGYESAEDLAKKFNLLNWRGHPESQASALDDSLDALGWVGSVKVNLQTQKIFDGHLRVTRALLKDPALQIPVDYYDLTPDEEALALQVHDAITEQAQPIPEKLAALMEKTKAMVADRPGLSEMMNQMKEKLADVILADGNKKQRIGRSGRLYNSGDGHNVEPFKLAHRIEAIWQARGKKAIDLYSGQGQLASWYKRRFESVITIDKVYPVGDVDYQMTAIQFISQILPNHIDFDFIDFDDEGTPAREIQEFFNVIAGKKNSSFILALTDGNGLNLKFRGRFDFSVYLTGDTGLRQSTLEDYVSFEETVSNFIITCATGAKFTPTNLSSYRGREGNVLFQTWLIEPNCAELSGAGYDTHPADTAVSLS